MDRTHFFKTTPLYKEFLILTMIKNDSNVTQRELGKGLDVSAAMVNKYLDEYEKKKFIKRKYASSKTVEYLVSEEGEARRKYLNIEYLKSALSVYNNAKEDCYKFFNEILDRGYKNILFYGAGEVAEIMLSVINNTKDINLNVLAIIDDDITKQGQTIINKSIIGINDVNKYEYDGILISIYSNSKDIYNRLITNNIDKNKILQFFDVREDK